MKEYKPLGQFYSDSVQLCNLYGIKLHPMFREPVLPQPSHKDSMEKTNESAPDPVGAFDDQKKIKEPTTLTISKYRIDPNSLKVLFKVLEGCPHIQTLK